MFFSRKPNYVITIPTEYQDLDSVVNMSADTFGEGNVDKSTLISAYRTNMYSHICLKDTDDNLRGFLDFFLFKPETFDAFLAGTTEEALLTADDFLPLDPNNLQDRVYLGAIVAFNTNGKAESGRSAHMMLYALARLMLEKYGISENHHMQGYACGYSTEGIALLERLGFTCISDGAERRDKYPLYTKLLDKSAIEAMLRQFERFCNRNCVLTIR